MTPDPISELAALRTSGVACALVTVISTSGSTPRKAGAKMLVALSHSIPTGTIGGGKLEALAIAEAQKRMSSRETDPVIQSYPLHEADEHSFGAICGGEVTLLTETFPPAPELVIVGAGHCGAAIARLANLTGLAGHVVDDRPALLLPLSQEKIRTSSQLEELDLTTGNALKNPRAFPLGFIAVSRNHQTDLAAIRYILPFASQIPYLGMIGSKRKVGQVFETLLAEGADPATIAKIYAPIGLDIGAESPEEIALSVLAQFLAVTREKRGGHLCEAGEPQRRHAI